MILIAIAHFFIDLCLLRRGPQDAPPALALLLIACIVASTSSLLLIITAGNDIIAGLAQTGVDYMLLLVLVWITLVLLDKRTRFIQTATALMGTDSILSLLALLPMILVTTAVAGSAQLLLAGGLFLGLIGWNFLVTAHILRHAFGIHLLWGVVLAVAYELFTLILWR